MNKFCIEKHTYLLTDKTHSIEYIYLDCDELITFMIMNCNSVHFALHNDMLINYNEGYKYNIKGYKDFLRKEMRNNRLDDILDIENNK